MAGSTQDSVPDINLLDDEELLHDSRASWANWWKSLILYGTIAVFSAGLLSPLLAIPWLQRHNTRYIVTSERVIKRTGLLSTSTTEYQISDLKEIQTERSIGDHIFGTGTVRLSTDPGDTGIVFGGIRNADEVVRSIRSNQ